MFFGRSKRSAFLGDFFHFLGMLGPTVSAFGREELKGGSGKLVLSNLSYVLGRSLNSAASAMKSVF